MRFIKPKKGFRLSKNLGLLLFSTAVLSGSLSDNKAYGLEAPSMPPSVLMASAKNSDANSSSKVVKPSEKKEVKVEKAVASPKKEVKSVPASAASVDNKDKVVKENETTPAPIIKQNLAEEKTDITPAAPPSVLVSSVKNQNIKQLDDEEDDDADDEFSIKGEEQPKPSSNLIASAKIVENDSSAILPKSIKEEKASAVKKEVAPVEKKAEAKPVEKKESQKQIKAEVPTKKAEVKPAEKTISDNSAKKEIVKPSSKASEKPVEMKKAEKSEVKEEIKPEVKKHSKVRRVKRVTVEDKECPPEWDWFSKPLVFVRDANGKLVITADKNAPDIVIGSKKTSDNDIKSLKAVKAENKVAQVRKPAVKKTKKAESPEYVEAKPVEAPAAPAVVVEPKPIVEEKTIEAKEETPVVSYAKPVVMIEKKAEEKPLFAEAAEKMARIKRLHAYDENKTVEVASTTRRSASMVRMHKLVVELIKRSDKKSNKDNRLLKASLSPQAPPEAENTSSIEEEKTVASNESYNQSNTEKYAFRPYVNPDFSSRIQLNAF